MSFDTYYPQNPWAGVETKERTPWYFPELYREFRRKAIYNRFVGMQFNHNGPRATELVVTTLVQPHANHDPIGLRDDWLDASFMDSYARKITFKRYAGKMSLNRYDDMITYWTLDGQQGLKKIIREGLGTMLVGQMDKLARDAFLQAPFALYGDGSGGWSGTGFNAIDGDDRITTQLLNDVILGLKERDNPVGVTEDGSMPQGIVCVTSPGVIRDLRFEATANSNANAFIDVMRYADPSRIIRGEVGTYNGIRFVETNNAILYNAGAFSAQTTIVAPISAGDGSPDPATTAVDSVEWVGQPSATHFIEVASVTGFNVGDIVTVHVKRTNAKGVTNGVDYTDGKLVNRRIVAINVGDNTISFDRPIAEDWKTQITSGVYGYVTKGRTIHTALFLTGQDGVAMGVAQPPIIHEPVSVGDLKMIYRISFDYYMGWQPFNKHGFEVVYLAGSNRVVGPRF